MEDGTVGTKYVHVSEISYSDKEHHLETYVSDMTFVPIDPKSREWQ